MRHSKNTTKARSSLEKLADLAVLEKDPLAVPADQWMDIKVERTLLGGKWVFEA